MSLDQITKVNSTYQSNGHNIIASAIALYLTLPEKMINERYIPLVTNIVVFDSNSSSATGSSGKPHSRHVTSRSKWTLSNATP